MENNDLIFLGACALLSNHFNSDKNNLIPPQPSVDPVQVNRELIAARYIWEVTNPCAAF
jgi:hypothetical protein